MSIEKGLSQSLHPVGVLFVIEKRLDFTENHREIVGAG